VTARASDFESFRKSVQDAVDAGDAAKVLAAIHPVAGTVAVEHGAAFRELVAGLPTEIWHNDPRVAAALGGSYRSRGTPRGQSALGYFRAAEGAIAATPETPAHCLAFVLLGHAAALRTLGQLTQARAKLDQALPIISTQLISAVPIRIEAGARWSLEMGILDLHDGAFDSSRRHLEYANGLAAEHLTRAEQIEILGALGLIDAAAGDHEQAEAHIMEARERADGTELLLSGYGAPALTAELMISNERYLLETAAGLEATALDAASRTEFEPFSLVLSAQLRALEGHLVVALDILNRARRRYADWDRHGICEDFAEALRAGVLIALAQGDDAWEILRTMDPGEHHAICPARLIGQLRLLHGDLLGADEAIRACEELGEAHAGRTLAEVQLVRASIELQRGNLATADLNADRSFLQMARTGSRMAVLRVPSASLFALAERAVDRRQLPEVDRLLTTFIQVYAGAEREVEALSPRERKVLAQVQRGLTVAAIANELYISPNTVKTHLRRLYRKLGVSTREEAMRAARSLGLDREITRDSPGQNRDSSEEAVL
jgi:ATP/maltotriose-dependent transcriptional regulator MalT